MRPLGPVDVNEDIRLRTGGDFTAKDFRTLRGTVAAADRLAELGTGTTKRARDASVREAIVRERGARQHACDREGELRRPAGDRSLRARPPGEPARRAETALLQLLVDDAAE